MADSVPWDKLEKRYAKRFKSKTGNVAEPLRMALGSLIIQTRYQYSDHERIEQLSGLKNVLAVTPRECWWIKSTVRGQTANIVRNTIYAYKDRSLEYQVKQQNQI